MRNYIVILLLSLSCCAVAASNRAKDFFENHKTTRNANVGVLVVDLKTGDTIDSYRANNLLPTASTMKVISTCTALDMYGPNFRWSTSLVTDSVGEDGVIGNLFIVGEGDPTLMSRKLGPDGQMLGDTLMLDTWVKVLQDKGVKRVTGRVVADMGMWNNDEAANPGWTWDNMGNYYGMGVTSLSYRDNVLNIYLQSGANGSHAEFLRTDPVVDGLVVASHVKCAQINYDGSYVRGVPFCNYRFMIGAIPSNKGEFCVKGDLPNPGLSLAVDLCRKMEEAGIEVLRGAGDRREWAPIKNGTTLYTHKSPTLAEVIFETNRNSNNHFAEVIFRTLGMRANVPATVADSRRTVAQWWRHHGVDFASANQLDGCGLAPQNAVAPKTFVSLLTYMYHSPNFDVFKASLPVSGLSGTLKSFLWKTRLQGKVFAKSGTINGLRSYTGYIYLDGGRVWAFSIAVHNGEGGSAAVRQVIEEYLLKVTE